MGNSQTKAMKAEKEARLKAEAEARKKAEEEAEIEAKREKFIGKKDNTNRCFIKFELIVIVN